MSCIAQFAQAYGPFITAGAIFISGGIAWLAIIHNLRTARRRATIDLMMHEKSNQTLIAARKIFLALHEDPAKITGFASKEHAGGRVVYFSAYMVWDKVKYGRHHEWITFG